jgi:hypothetical protein
VGAGAVPTQTRDCRGLPQYVPAVLPCIYAFRFLLLESCRLQSAQVELDKELRKGHVQVDQWLKKSNLPRLPLPVVCGYIPLVTLLEKGLRAPHESEVKKEL